MFETKCYKKAGTELIGQAQVNVRPEEGAFEEYLVRIVGIMNISIAISSITGPESGDYTKLVGYVASQYKALTATDLTLTGNNDESLKSLRNLLIILPKTARLNPSEQVLKNAMMRSLLRNA